MQTQEEVLAAARAAHERRDWRASYDGFARAQTMTPLTTPDLDAFGAAAWRCGHGRAAIRISEQVFEQMLRDASPETAATKALNIALTWINCGDLDIAQAWMSRARRVLDGVPEHPVHGYLAYLEALTKVLNLDADRMPDLADRLQDLATRLDSPAVSTLGLVVGAMAAIGLARTAEGLAMLDDAMLSLLADRVPVDWAGEIYCLSLNYCHRLGDFTRMRAWSNAMQRWCDDFAKSSTHQGVCDVHRAQLAVATEGFGAVEQELMDVIAALEKLHLWAAREGHYQLGEVRRMRGDVEGAFASYAEARALGFDPQPGEALLRCQQGDHRRAWSDICAAIGVADPLRCVAMLRGAVDIALAGGQLEEAERLCERLESEAERFDTAGFRAWAAHARGAVLVSRGKPAEGLAALRSALCQYRIQQCRYEIAQVYEWMSVAHRASREEGNADADAATAESIYQQLGVEPSGICGGPPLPAELTRRELEILISVASGATNRQVAQQHFITENTVGRHLANIYRKLGVSSRTAAVAWAHAHSLLPGRS